MDLPAIQQALQQQGVDGWLLYRLPRLEPDRTQRDRLRRTSDRDAALVST
jgi:hypothetical protein